MAPPKRRRPNTTRYVTAGVIALTGFAWIGQGLGIMAGRSFMVGDPLWALIGAGMVAFAAFLAIRELRATR